MTDLPTQSDENPFAAPKAQDATELPHRNWAQTLRGLTAVGLIALSAPVAFFCTCYAGVAVSFSAPNSWTPEYSSLRLILGMSPFILGGAVAFVLSHWLWRSIVGGGRNRHSPYRVTGGEPTRRFFINTLIAWAVPLTFIAAYVASVVPFSMLARSRIRHAFPYAADLLGLLAIFAPVVLGFVAGRIVYKRLWPPFHREGDGATNHANAQPKELRPMGAEALKPARQWTAALLILIEVPLVFCGVGYPIAYGPFSGTGESAPLHVGIGFLAGIVPAMMLAWLIWRVLVESRRNR